MAFSEEQILIRVKKVCAEVLKVDEAKMSGESRFKEDLGADSLDIISLLMTLEDDFNQKISDEEAMKFAAIKDVVAFIKSRNAEAP